MTPYSLRSHADTCWYFEEHRSYLIVDRQHSNFDAYGQMGFQTLANSNFVGVIRYNQSCVQIEAKKDRFIGVDQGLMRDMKEDFPSLFRLADCYWITDEYEMVQFRLTYGG